MLSAILGGIGDSLAEEHRRNMAQTHEGNQASGHALLKLSEDAVDPQLKQELAKEAMGAFNTVGKPHKNNLHGILGGAMQRMKQAELEEKMRADSLRQPQGQPQGQTGQPQPGQEQAQSQGQQPPTSAPAPAPMAPMAPPPTSTAPPTANLSTGAPPSAGFSSIAPPAQTMQPLQPFDPAAIATKYGPFKSPMLDAAIHSQLSDRQARMGQQARESEIKLTQAEQQKREIAVKQAEAQINRENMTVLKTSGLNLRPGLGRNGMTATTDPGYAAGERAGKEEKGEDPSKMYKIRRYQNGQETATEVKGDRLMVKPEFDAASPTGATNNTYNPRTGEKVGGMGKPVISGLLPTERTNSTNKEQWTDVGDKKVLTNLNTTTTNTSRRVLPGAAAPPTPSGTGGSPPKTRVIDKTLTPVQEMTASGKLGALDNTLDLAQSVKSKLPLISHLIDAQKIKWEMDPDLGILKAIRNRAMPMSPEEAQLAGDFASLTEHINTLRGPLGATGFRGHEAWQALQAQRGQLTAHPEVVSRILDNTIKALNAQRSSIGGALGKGNRPMEPPPTGGTGTVHVTVGGKTYPFPDQKSADAFKKAAAGAK